jgi:hypothetical protein
MAKKNTGKAKHAAPARKPREQRLAQAFKEDPPPMANAIELGKKYSVDDETIRNYGKLPHAPAQVRPGKWVIAEFDRFYEVVRQHGGPAGFKKWVEESDGPGMVRAPRRTNQEMENLTAADREEATRAAQATTPEELMRFKTEHIQKAKLVEEVLTRRLANQERKRRLVPRAAVEEVIYARGQKIKALARKLTLELPPKLLGLDRPEIEAKLALEFDQFLLAASEFGEPMHQSAAPADTDPGAAEPAEPAPPPLAEGDKPPPGGEPKAIDRG